VPRVISVQRNRVEPRLLDLGSLLAPGHRSPGTYGVGVPAGACSAAALRTHRAESARADLGRPGVRPLAHATPGHRLRNLIPGRQVSASAARTP
jgi:hypothetical protein